MILENLKESIGQLAYLKRSSQCLINKTNMNLTMRMIPFSITSKARKISLYNKEGCLADNWLWVKISLSGLNKLSLLSRWEVILTWVKLSTLEGSLPHLASKILIKVIRSSQKFPPSRSYNLSSKTNCSQPKSKRALHIKVLKNLVLPLLKLNKLCKEIPKETPKQKRSKFQMMSQLLKRSNRTLRCPIPPGDVAVRLSNGRSM